MSAIASWWAALGWASASCFTAAAMIAVWMIYLAVLGWQDGAELRAIRRRDEAAAKSLRALRHDIILTEPVVKAAISRAFMRALNETPNIRVGSDVKNVTYMADFKRRSA